MKFGLSRRPKTISIVAGGTLSTTFLSGILNSNCIIGVDRGAFWLIDHGVAPDIAIGDFDSVTGFEKQRIRKISKKIIEFPPKKDATDLELAVDQTIRLKPLVVRIYGGLGNRFDHSWVAVQMLLKLESHNIYGEIVDNFNKIMIVRRKLTISKDAAYRYVSVIPLELQTSLTLKGFIYNVTRIIFDPMSSLGISNVIAQKSAIITAHSGRALVIQSRD